MRERGIDLDGGAAGDALLDLVRREAPARLFARDGSLWSADPAKAAEIGRWLGWLPVLDEMAEAAPELEGWARHAAEDHDRVVLLGSTPGRVIEQLDIPFPRPRQRRELSRTPEFVALRQRIDERFQQDLIDRIEAESLIASVAEGI